MMSNLYTKKQVKDLFDNGLEFWYIGIYDWEKRVDSRHMGIDYILEYIREMLESKYYKRIDLYYWWCGEVYKLPDLNKKKELSDFAFAYYEMI